MNPLSQRISLVEKQLAHLKNKANRLSKSVNELKDELTSEEEVIITPPPSPSVTPTEAASLSFAEVKPEKEESKLSIIPAKESKQPCPQPSSSPSAEEVTGIEMQLGRVWSVRLGILLLTTGFVFLSRYTYDNLIRDLGPGFRLTMMYLFSFLLTGAGLFCESWKESLKSYGRIVAAGGLAAIYYCSFAAHNVEALQVIENPVLASIVLSLSAALFCAISLWRESRLMLSTSLALAFYSISVNPIGWMACLSALILATFGILMMIRYRWVEVGFVVLIGSYLSYTWWQFAIAQGESDTSRWFLISYWLLFTTAALFARRDLNEDRHILFSSLNNSAFFFLFSFQLESFQWMDHHWLFCLIFGTTLMALGLCTKKQFSEKLRLVHLAKGLGIFTLGLALYLEGHHLFIALLIEALVLMALNLKSPNVLTKAASWGIALLSCLTFVNSVPSEIPSLAYLFGTFAWLTLGTLHRLTEPEQASQEANPGGLVAATIAFAFGSIATWAMLSQKIRPYLFDTLAILHGATFIALTYLISLPNMSSSTFLIGSALALLTSIPSFLDSRAATSPEKAHPYHVISGAFLAVSLGLFSLALYHSEVAQILQLILILAIPIAGTFTARHTGLLAHSFVPFAMYLNLLQLDLFQSSFLLLGVITSFTHLIIVTKHHRLIDQNFLRVSLTIITSLFWAGLLLKTFPEHPALPLTLTAVALLLTTRFSPKFLNEFLSIPFFAIGFAHAFFLGATGELYLCLIAPLALHLTRTQQEAKIRYHILASFSLLLLYIQISNDFQNSPLAATWAITGTVLLLIGLALKSRCFRLIALLILLASLGHLMLIDLVKLEALPRILSFMTLGIGLLALGFVYNRYQERLKQIL